MIKLKIWALSSQGVTLQLGEGARGRTDGQTSYQKLYDDDEDYDDYDDDYDDKDHDHHDDDDEEDDDLVTEAAVSQSPTGQHCS